MTRVRIPTPLRSYVGGEKDLVAQGDTVDASLHDLVRRHPSLGPHLFDGNGQLRSYVVLFVNDQDVRDLQGPATRLSEGDRLVIVPSIAGGGSR